VGNGIGLEDLLMKRNLWRKKHWKN